MKLNDILSSLTHSIDINISVKLIAAGVLCSSSLKYPVPIKKETQGSTDLYVASWMRSRPRDKVGTMLISR